MVWAFRIGQDQIHIYMSSIEKSLLSISYLNKPFFRNSSTLSANNELAAEYSHCLFDADAFGHSA